MLATRVHEGNSERGTHEGADRVVCFLHGMLGNKNNWLSFAGRVAALAPDLMCVMADLRGHGASHGLPPPHSVHACVDDVLALDPAPHVIVGHSFGGKVALAAGLRGAGGVTDVIVLDAPPGERGLGDGAHEIERVFAAIARVAIPIESRRALVVALRAQGLTQPLCQWMTTNLKEAAGGGYTWMFDLDVATALLTSFAQLDLWPALDAYDGAVRLHLIRAGQGGRFTTEDIAHLDALKRDGRITSHLVLPQAGHWLHTDDPSGLLALLTPLFVNAV